MQQEQILQQQVLQLLIILVATTATITNLNEIILYHYQVIPLTSKCREDPLQPAPPYQLGSINHGGGISTTNINGIIATTSIVGLPYYPNKYLSFATSTKDTLTTVNGILIAKSHLSNICSWLM